MGDRTQPNEADRQSNPEPATTEESNTTERTTPENPDGTETREAAPNPRQGQDEESTTTERTTERNNESEEAVTEPGNTKGEEGI